MSNEKRKMIIIKSIIVLSSMSLFITSGEMPVEINDMGFERGAPGEDDEELVVEAVIGEVKVEELSLNISARDYSKEECAGLSQEVRSMAVNKLLGKNEDLMNVKTDLCFFNELEGFPFTFEIRTAGKDGFSASGEILRTDTFEETIFIAYEYGDYKDEFPVKIWVNPNEDVKERIYRRKLSESFKESQDGQSETVILPQEIEGERVRYTFPGHDRNPAWLIIGAISVAAVTIGDTKDRRDRERKRKEEILEEYPQFLQKMSLYLATGMTVRNIFVALYEERLKSGESSGPLYEEMKILVNELQSGVSEGMAYKRFGERTKVNEFVRFTALLSQNLKKGSSSLSKLFSEEVSKAYEGKRQRAVKKGEEMGTKLLVPMLLMLIDVLIMIMVPAFWTM